MLASKTCRGSTTSVRATQATFQIDSWPSALSTRPTRPSLNPIGYVIASVRAAATVRTITASRQLPAAVVLTRASLPDLLRNRGEPHQHAKVAEVGRRRVAKMLRESLGRLR